MVSYERKNLRSLDEEHDFEKAKYGVLNIDGRTVEAYVFEPGWRWTQHAKEVAGTDLCEDTHLMHHISGRLAILLEDGTEFVAEPGDVTLLPPRHDAWVVGDEPAVAIDWHRAAQPAEE
jgi:hypothetical protein